MDTNNNNEELEKEQAEEASEENTQTEKTEEAPAEESSAEQKRIEELEKQLGDEKDKYLRVAAEYDNFRKRSAKEKEGIYADAYSDCVKNLLPVLDNLERAEKCDQLDGLKKGVEMTLKEFQSALGKLGITEVETDRFDPNLHNAVMHIEDDSLGESAIVEGTGSGGEGGNIVEAE